MKEYKLSEILTIKNGRDYKNLKNGLYPVYGSGGLMCTVDNYLYERPSVLLPRKGTLSNIQFADSPFWTVDTLYYTEIDTHLADPYYLYYYLKQLDLTRLDSGTGVPSMTFDSYYNIKVCLPNIDKQRAVGQLLSVVDDKIQLNKRINDNLEAMAKQLYEYWFVQFDFPNEEGKPYKSSGGAMVWNEKLKREIPQGWSVLSVNDIAASVRGVSYAKDDMVDSNNGVLVLRGNNIQDNHLIYDSNVAYIPSSFVSENQRIRPLDIIMTMSSGSKEHIGKSAMFQFASEDTFGAFLTKFTAKEHCAYLLFNLFNSKYFKAKIKSIACGTGINNLTNQTFDEIYVVMPEDELLLEFDKRQSQIFAEIGLIEKSNIELTRQQDELLPLLMNGQATVNYHLSTQNCFKESTNSASISPIFSQNSA